MPFDRRANFEAYAQVESLENYKTQEEIESYRKERIARYADPVGFFHSRSQPGKGCRVVEIGSGSSALLYAMEQKGLLLEAVGIDQSRSRHEFAQLWKEEWNFSKVTNIRSDFIDVRLQENYFDWYIVIDNTFSYLYPEDKRYPLLLLRQARGCLKENGFIIIEINNYLPFFTEGEKKSRIKLPDTNPFSYALYHRTYYPEENILKSDSVYIQKDGREKSKTELSYVYSPDALASLLSGFQFEKPEVYSDFRLSPFEEKKSLKMVIVARKSSL